MATEEEIYSNLLRGYARNLKLLSGRAIHARFIKGSLPVSLFLQNHLLNMYVKTGDVLGGLKVFDEMPHKNVVSWSAVIAGYIQNGYVGGALSLFSRMHSEGATRPNEFTLMAAGCLQCGEPRTALAIITQMRRVGAKPNRFTLATALNACANVTSLEPGKQIHVLRIKLGDDIDVCVDNALLDMYAKGGCMDNIWSAFQTLKDHTVISWTTLIMACAQNGQAKEALQVFDEMRKSGIEPNYITFICVLYACCQGRFIDEGWRYFSSVTKDYGISPGEDHYVCMVNLLGRAGLIKEAMELILTMPFEPGAPVWQTLLCACQIHGDVEIGKLAARRTMEQDDKDPSTYVVLSNMFSGLSSWDGVWNLRELMELRDVKKKPGSSWIEIG